MSKILEDIHSPEWWFTVVFIGTVISIFSAGILRFVPSVSNAIQRLFKFYSTRMKEGSRREFALAVISQEHLHFIQLMKINADIQSGIFIFFGLGTLSIGLCLGGTVKLITIIMALAFSLYGCIGAYVYSVVSKIINDVLAYKKKEYLANETNAKLYKSLTESV